MSKMNTKDWFDFIRGETESALTLLYSYMGFSEALRYGLAVKAANENPDFWRVHTAAIQNTLFIYLGRLTDDSSDGKSFSDFQGHCICNINDFTATKFRLRRPEALIANPRFLDGAIFPVSAEIKRLFALATKPNKILRAECKTIRTKVFAHAIFTQEHEHNHLFQGVQLIEVEQALLVLHSIVSNLYESFRNARQLSFEIHSFHEKDQIFQNVRRAIMGESKPVPTATFT